MPMETEIVALGSQRPRNGRRMGGKELWTMADEPDSSRTPRFQLTSPRTKSRHGAFIVCRSNSCHCNSPECPAVQRVFGIRQDTMSKMHTANNTKDQIGKKWDSMWAEQRNLDALISALLGIRGGIREFGELRRNQRRKCKEFPAKFNYSS
ncbi:GD22215 [Drosophila simulans]|uniref:GD22215 n=1 Tax=Drosophila simulans TaxID=7240 RepID=B4Q9V7_DROSI|nr:GD22215 [Drosophila simulans]